MYMQGNKEAILLNEKRKLQKKSIFKNIHIHVCIKESERLFAKMLTAIISER